MATPSLTLGIKNRRQVMTYPLDSSHPNSNVYALRKIVPSAAVIAARKAALHRR